MRACIIILSVICACCTTTWGQTLRAYITAAENAMAEKDYYTAYTHFGTAVDIDSSRMDLVFKLGEAAREFHSYTEAERMYRTVLDSDQSADYPLAAFWLGQTQQIQGKYDSAIASYQIYLGEHAGDDSLYTAEANRMIESCQWAKDNLRTTNDTTTVKRLGDTVNTLYSEFGAVRTDEMLYFTRLGYARKNKVKNREVPPAILYSKVLGAEGDGTSVPLDSILNDSTLHTAHTTFSHDGTRVYYTLCAYLNRSDIRCDLYYREIDNGVWGEPQKLDAPVNAEGSTTTQPCVAYDDAVGKEVLYFVSDRDGGNGGLDIWYAEIDDAGQISTPRNLTGINTPYDDVTPFFHEESNTLYFSTSGRPGFGGFDIFQAEQTATGLGEPVNIGPDINSSYHDVYYTLNEDESEGLFSSNRLGSIFIDHTFEACCYDVYEVTSEPVEVDLIVETFNRRTMEPLSDVTVYVESKNGQLLLVTHTTGTGNRLELPLKRNKRYTLIGTRDGFEPDTAQFDTYNISQSVTINQRLLLRPEDVVVEVQTFDARQRQPLPNVTVDILDSGNNLLERKTNPTGHISYFAVDPGQDYTITGKRKGYRQASVPLLDSELIGQDTVIKQLYLPLGNLEEFLPLAIYFDNDEPEPRSRIATTSKRYLETYEPYYAQKDKFVRRYARGLPRDEEATAEAEIEAFFEDSLRNNKEEFESFLNILNQYLDEGLTFKIYLKGYASPLASDQYNYLLGQRRINTIQNEFAAFRGGVLQKYFESGALEVVEKSFGEEEAPPNVSDDVRNLRGSVYSPEASIERRVEIIELEKDNPNQ